MTADWYNPIELKIAILKSGKIQWKLAFDAGLSPSVLSAIIRGVRPARSDEMQAIAEALALSQMEIFPAAYLVWAESQHSAGLARRHPGGGGRPPAANCKRGHKFSPENVVWDLNQRGEKIRKCRACRVIGRQRQRQAGAGRTGFGGYARVRIDSA